MCQGIFNLDTTIELENNENENEEENPHFIEIEPIDDESFYQFMDQLMNQLNLESQEWEELNLSQEIHNELIQQ